VAASNKGNIIATRSVTQMAHANACARRGLVLPENASKKEGPVSTTGPEIYKAPNHHERNLYCEFIRS
jgi:hypothetical protein